MPTSFSRPSVPLRAWAALFLLGGIILVGTFVRPMMHVPDERFHVDMVLTATAGDGWPAPKSRTLDPAVAAASRLARQKVRDPGNALPPRSEKVQQPVCHPSTPLPDCDVKPTLEELARQYPKYKTPVNRMTQHPPAYYLLTGGTVGTLTTLTMRTVPYDGQVWLYRLISLALVAPIALIGHSAARELGLPPALRVTAAVMPAALTGLTLRNAAIVNNDNLLMPLMFAVTYAFVLLHRRGPDRRLLIGLGALLGLSLITKGTALLTIPAIPVSLWLLTGTELTTREHLVSTGKHTAVVGISALVAGGWWPIRNLLFYGTPQPGGIRFPDASEAFEASLGHWLSKWMPQILVTGLGRTGRLLVEHPVLIAILVAALVGATVLAVRRVGWRLIAAINLPLAVTAVGWTMHAYRGYTRHGLLSSGNARYYYPLLLGAIITIVLAMWDISTRTRVPAQLWAGAAVILIAVVNATEIGSHLRATWSDTRSVWDGLQTLSLWSPAPIALMYAGAGVAVISAVAILVPSRLDRER